MTETVCAQLKRCAYAVADEMYGDGTEDEGCPYWRDCFANQPLAHIGSSRIDGTPTQEGP